MRFQGVETAYHVTHCRFEDNHYGLRDLANRDAILTYCEFRSSGYVPLQFAHPVAARVLMEQNNLLPGPGGRRVELVTTRCSYTPGRYLPAMSNWWGTTDYQEIISSTSLVGDGRYTANSDTTRVDPVS
jgi:hypothetical protein